MKKDIEIPKVEGVYVAVVQEDNGEGEMIWNVYLVNDKDELIESAFVSSKGYLKEVNGAESKTSTLRHSLKDIAAKTSIKIEPIMPDVFKLNNEYFVSFFLNGTLFDKKFIFLSETIKESNLSTVPLLEKEGVWIK
tara:strand:- start:1635 stop:2042 length:408 start_codon:yes stop_codon:yes gene_type:complete